MSLLVWLPLTGDLRNQGLSDALFSTIGTVSVNDSGKIGKSYYFGTASSSIYSNTNFTATAASAACWIKLDTVTSTTQWGINLNYDGTGNAKTLIGFYITTAGVLYTAGGLNTTYSTTISPNTWYHICVTWDMNVGKKLYINGQLVHTNTTKGTSFTTTSIHISGRAANAALTTHSYGINGGYLNDVRIYDHCLSDKEVEEIAKGLVLHYKLDGSSILNPNLFKLNYIDLEWNICHPANYYAYGLALTEALELNQDYTVLLWDVDVAHSAKTAALLGLRLYLGGGNNLLIGWFGTDYFTNGHADYLYGTFKKSSWTNTSQAENLWILIYNSPGSADGTRNMHIGAWKIEKGTVPTPLNAFNENIIYDSSGYGNNGIITGDMQIDTNTPRYKTSIKKASGQYIRVEKKCADCMPKDAITVSIWLNTTTWANPISCTQSGGWNFENNSGIQFPVYISGVGYKTANSGITTASTLNNWHMLTGTMDKDNVKIYYDGVEKATTAKGSTNDIGYANNYVFIGGEAAGNTVTPASSGYVGNISDVRIYATALTANLILELYNTSATIDNKGNVYAREVIE